MKKITSILLVVLLVLTCLTMAACDPTVPFDTAGAREKLDLYIFEQEGQVISGEFVLPGTIGGFNATWTSSSELVVLTEVPADEDNGIERQYTVKVGYPEAVTEVELTVALSSDVKKTFKVIVNPLSVHDFIEAYSFLQDKGTVVADFALDRTVDFAGKAATIAWSVDEAYTDYIEISEDGNTCVVYPTSLNPTVKIKATFTYNGESATKSYRMTVSEVKEHLQAVDYWYANTGVGMEMKGYVVEIATAYAPSYGNISLYIVDEDFCAGYYIYRVKCDQATADRLVPGAPVIVTGTTNTNYNGLIETNAGGTITIDDSREALTELPVHALDEEVVGKLFSANYHQSTLVSLTNWKVKEVKDAPAAGETSTLFIIEKGGVEVSVAVSKYMEGAYLTKADDAVWSALAAHGIQVGDIVTVTGVLGNYKGHQIMPLSIDGIVKGDTESTVTAGVTAGAAVKAIDKAIADNGLNGVVAVEKNVALPTVDGATITAKVLGSSRAVSVVDGAIVVAPGKLENACVQIDITVGEFTTSIFRYIQSADLDDAEKLAMEAAALVFEIEEIKESGKFDLPTASIFSNITVTWSTNNACAVVDGNVLTVKLPTEAVELTLTATLTLGEATPVTVDFKVAVAALSQQYIAKPISEAKVGTFKLAMYQGNLNKTLYFAGDMNGYYYATTEDYVDATDIVVAKSTNDGFYTLSFVDAAGATKYLAIKSDGEHTNVLIVDEAADWGWDADIKAFYTMVGTDKTYLGTRNDKNYTTMSAVASKYATTNFIARTGAQELAETGFITDAEAKVGTFKLAMYQGNLNKTLYFAGDMNGFYYATTEDYVDATDIVIAKSTNDGFYTLSFVDAAGATKYLAIKSDGEHTNVLIVDEAADWGWDADIKAFYTMVGTDKTYLGTRNDKNYTTMSAVASKYATTNFIARTGLWGFVVEEEAEEETPAEKITTIADALTAAVGAEAELSGTVVEITEAWSSYNNMSFYISDGTNRILVYRGVTQVGLGDVVTVTGTIGTFSNSNQIAQGSTAVITTVHVCSTYTDATCTEAAKCTVCGKANGEALGHIDENPADGTCDRCQVNLQQAASQVTASKTIAELATANSWSNGVQYSSFALDSVITVSSSTTGNNGKYYTSGNNYRLYQGDSGTMTITAAEGYEIVSVKVTYAQKNNGCLTLTGSNLASGTTVDVNAQSITFGVGNTGTATNGQAQVTAIEVVYRPVQA